MEATALQPYYGNDCPFNKTYKIYSDGSHYIARPQVKGIARKYKKRPQTEIDVLFDEFYKVGVRSVLDEKDKSIETRTAKLVPFIFRITPIWKSMSARTWNGKSGTLGSGKSGSAEKRI